MTKNELGEKLVKPLVNLHVTPNEGIIGKIGNLFLAKKGSLHKHYHHHLHRYPPAPIYHGDHDHHHHSEGPPFLSHPPHGPIIEGPPHHFEGPPPFLSHPPPQGPIFDGPIHHGPPIHHHGPPPHLIFSKPPPPFLKSSGGFSKDVYFDDIGLNPNNIGFRSNNISFNDLNYQSVYPEKNFDGPKSEDDTRYARNFNSYSLPTQAPGTLEGSEKVSFPTSRRRRDTDQPVPDSIEEKHQDSDSSIESEDTEGRAINANKRQAFYQPQQKQCGPRAVCCRRPFVKPAAAPIQYNRCGVRSAQGINGRIKNPTYVDGNSEFGEWPW